MIFYQEGDIDMSDSKYVLAMYDVRGKQEFIFRTNKLQEIVGASWLIRDVFKDYLFPVADGYDNTKGIYSYAYSGNDSDSGFSVTEFEKRLEKKEYIGEVVYEGGGNFIVLFRDKESFKSITYKFTKKIMEEIGTLRVLGTYIEIDNFDDYERDRSKLYRKHRINESQESNISPWSCLPIVQVDRKTSQPLVDYDYDRLKISSDIKGKILQKGVKGKLPKESIAKLIKYFSEIKKIREEIDVNLTNLEKDFYKKNEDILDNLVTEKGKDSKLAVVYIDGNNMGAKVQAETKDSKTYEESVYKLRVFSKNTQKIYVEDGVEHALEGLNGENGKRVFRVVVSAGDEINFIVNAHDAFKCAKNYLDYLKKVGDGASACAGIAVFNSHAPYADVYRIAEEACESGKQKMKKAKMDIASFIDFHICQGAIGISLEDIRKEENGNIISRPWMIWSDGKQDNPNEHVTDYKDVKKKLDFISKFARSNVKGLISSAKEGIVPLQMEINRMYGHAKQEYKEKSEKDWKDLMDELGGKKAGVDPDDIRSMIYDLALAYDLWFAKEVEK